MSEVISWIKGPAGTIVTLTIQREWNIEPLILQVTRERIIINDIEYSKPNRTTAYIEIKSFWEKVDSQFKDALEEIANDNSIRKIIFDVRNNPGWYLQKVSNMLWYILPKNSVTAIVHQWDDDLEYKSKGQDIIDINKYKIIILQNGGSASASEIFTGTLKDYYSEITILWEQSFWKGSVQTLKNYYDGSTLKYTTAKWFTWKTRIGIDGIGITPDKMLLFDTEKWSELKIDNQLNQALNM
jgi:carboxyl-terminal processing protease